MPTPRLSTSSRPRAAAVGLAIVAAIVLQGCALFNAPIVAPNGGVSRRTIVLNDHPLTLHLANASAAGRAPLLVYATGDCGWAGKDLDTFRHLAAWGYPVVGFDAHDYVKHLGARGTTTPARLARDYEAIIDAAKQAMQIPPQGAALLVGVSRGADLSVVAAGSRTLRIELRGIVVVGLTHEEEYVKGFRRRGSRRGPAAANEREMVLVYDYIPRLQNVPITVIQSTHDNYLPADKARGLFGPDTATHRLIPVAARNHSFSDARGKMYETLRAAIAALAAAP